MLTKTMLTRSRRVRWCAGAVAAILHLGSAPALADAVVFDDFTDGADEGWQGGEGVDAASFPLALGLEDCGYGGGRCLRVVNADSDTATGFLITNAEQWAGSLSLPEVSDIRLRIRHSAPGAQALVPRFALRGADPDGPGPMQPSCYVSPVPGESIAPSSEYTLFTTGALQHFVPVLSASGCSATPVAVHEVLRNVTQVRLFSSPVADAWTPTTMDGAWTVHVDSLRNVSPLQTQWRFIGRKQDPNATCADANAVDLPLLGRCDTAGRWDYGHLFGDPSDP
ncbi:MAG: hypothetical protein AAFX85_05385, partial [Pseudomonadota bacterium]